MGSTTQKQLVFTLSLAFCGFLAYLNVRYLGFLEDTVYPEVYLTRISIIFTAFFLPIVGGWYSLRILGSVIFCVFAAIMIAFTEAIVSSTVFIWFLLQYGALCFLLYRMQQYFENQIASTSVDVEKNQSEKNDLEVSYKVKGEGISILFEKYSTYYNLRKLAEQLATTLSIEELSRTIMDSSMDFIGRGDIAMLTLASADGHSPELIAFKRSETSEMEHLAPKHHPEDLFEQWVIKNRRRLIITDSHQDFRFDLHETARDATLRSLIIAPILHQGHVIGTIRINSEKTETFSNDDLRLLDTIAVLASSALSNAMLYEKTEQLAIHDSLTGLFVRRYFFDRLKEEHRRALMMKRSMSLLMCDLDHFKEINDSFGHSVGDLILVHFTKILKENSESGIVGRYGGEEFTVLLPETTKQKAAEVAEKIRKALEEAPYSIRREEIKMSVSIGVATVPDDSLDLETLVQKADEALYEAKRQGRNRVCLSKE